jgi:hypothetical protein
MNRCKSCQAEIVFAKVTGKSGRVRTMPFDAEPLPDGEWQVTGERAIYVGKEPSLFASDRHRTHFATCPNADQHRKR